MIVFSNLSHLYQKKYALEDISLTIPSQTLMAITGPNGAGKSTILKIIAGLVKPTKGNYDRPSVKRIAYLPQQLNLDRSFPLTVREVIAMGFWSQIGNLRRIDETQEKQLEEALKTVGLLGFANYSLADLSGGQFQRVLFARLMIQDADVLLLDEPFSAVDEPTTLELLQLLQLWHRQGKSLLVVMHNVTLIKAYFPKTLILARKVIAYGNTEEVLTSQNLLNSYFLEETERSLCQVC